MTGGSGPEPLEAELPPARQWRQFKVEQEHDAFLHAEACGMAPNDAEAWLAQTLGPSSALVYPGRERPRIRDQLTDLLQEFPTLRVQTQQYTHTNGSMVDLLMAEGTLPMYYAGVKYNIPVQLWLPEHFPHSAPIIYVVPTADMIIKPRHSFVDPSGVVATPYILQWSRVSNLVDLCQDTMMSFGHDPPLFSKGPGYSEPPPRSQPHPPSPSFQAHNPIHRPPPYSGSNVNGPSPSATPGANIWGGAVAAATGQPNLGYGPGPGPGPGRQHSPAGRLSSAQMDPPQPLRPNLKEVFTGAAREALTARLQGSMSASNAHAAAEMDTELSLQSQLQSRARTLQQGIGSLTDERVALEQSVAELNGKAIAMERWLADNESKLPAGDIDADSAIVAADVLSRQALDAQAEDLALEDAMYELDKVLQDSNQPIDAYLKQIRSLCRRQFFVRALGNKVAACQHDHHRTGFARPFESTNSGQHRHVQMPQGDSWSNTGILANPLASHR